MICRSVTSRVSIHSLPHTSAKSCPSQGVSPDSAIRQPMAPSSGPRSGRGTSSSVRSVSTAPALRRPQPLDPPYGLGRDDAGRVVQDEAGEQRPVLPDRDTRRELGEHQPRQDPRGVGVPALGQIDPHPYGVVEGAQREGPRLPRRVEEPGERGPVEQRDPVREHAAHVARVPQLPLPRVEFAQQRLLSRRRSSALRSAPSGSGRTVEELAQLGHGGEAAVDGTERPEELGERRWSSGGCRRRGAGRRGPRRAPRRARPRPRRGRWSRRTGRGRRRTRDSRSVRRRRRRRRRRARHPRRRPRRRRPARRARAGTATRRAARRRRRSCRTRRGRRRAARCRAGRGRGRGRCRGRRTGCAASSAVVPSRTWPVTRS